MTHTEIQIGDILLYNHTEYVVTFAHQFNFESSYRWGTWFFSFSFLSSALNNGSVRVYRAGKLLNPPMNDIVNRESKQPRLVWDGSFAQGRTVEYLASRYFLSIGDGDESDVCFDVKSEERAKVLAQKIEDLAVEFANEVD